MNVLLTGATGYIGRRLKKKLLDDPRVALRLLVLNRNEVSEAVRNRVDIVEGSTFDEAALQRALDGIDVAYYLIHSMGAGGDFAELDRRSATNFINAALSAGVQRVIYLGGLGAMETASKHLKSRHETGEILSAHPERIRAIWFRAGAIIGSGSASFEIIHHLVQKLPVMITPTWVRTKTEPVGIRDVVAYLHAALDVTADSNLMVEIGAGQMTFADMITGAARVMGLRRLLLQVPFFSPRLSSYWLVLITPVPYGIAAPLVMGLKTESIRQNDHAKTYFPGIDPEPYETTVRTALDEIEQNQVVSRWSDGSTEDLYRSGALPMEYAVSEYRVVQSYPDLDDAAVFATVESMGGCFGWFSYHLLWQMRGFYDKVTGGCGLNRGRRDPNALRIGDSLDFWRVIDIVPGRRLLLFAQMRLPGKGWLEIVTQHRTLTVTAYFLPDGLLGRLYWYGLWPAHRLIFNDMARQIIQFSRQCTLGGQNGNGAGAEPGNT